jgi:transcriptional regulator with XRE-family HTH domain
MNDVRNLRKKALVTQAELAAAAGTSQPTVAAYEAGRKSPTLRTLRRLARAVGWEMEVSFAPAMTREDRRSLFLHRAIAEQLRRSPERVVRIARRNLRRMRDRHPEAAPLLEEWTRILGNPVSGITAVMTDPGMHARELRQVTPFAGVLTAAQRAAVYREFRRHEAGR